MDGKNNESVSDIPATYKVIVAAIISARARKRYQQLIIGSQRRLAKMDHDGR